MGFLSRQNVLKFPFFFNLHGIRNAGEGGTDLEEKVLLVSEALAHAFDEFGLVVDAFKKPANSRSKHELSKVILELKQDR
ncbi:MAG: hypothetical protein HQ546_03790 [Planctomycetes bacterium]|nr:hypothetical protein [Planctomycetota bacterium]